MVDPVVGWVGLRGTSNVRVPKSKQVAFLTMLSAWIFLKNHAFSREGYQKSMNIPWFSLVKTIIFHLLAPFGPPLGPHGPPSRSKSSQNDPLGSQNGAKEPIVPPRYK